MRNTKQFLRELAARNRDAAGKTASDYRLAQILGSSKQTVSNWSTGHNYFSDDACIRVAELLELEPGYVLACIHAERAKRNTEKAAWLTVAERFAAALAVLFLLGIGGPDNLSGITQASAAPMQQNYTLYAILALGLAAWALARRRGRSGGQYSPDSVLARFSGSVR